MNALACVFLQCTLMYSALWSELDNLSYDLQAEGFA